LREKKAELAWAAAEKAELSFQSVRHSAVKLNEKITICDQKVEENETTKRRLAKEKAAIEQTIVKAKNAAEQLHVASKMAREKHDRVKREHLEAQKSVAEADRKARLAENNAATLRAEIDKLTGAEGSDFENTQRKKKLAIDQMQRNVDDRHSQLKAKRAHIDNLDSSLRAVQDKRHEVIADKLRAANGLEEAQKQLRELSSSR